jgi:hypothetical protein
MHGICGLGFLFGGLRSKAWSVVLASGGLR